MPLLAGDRHHDALYFLQVRLRKMPLWKIWIAGYHVEKKEGPVLFVVAALAADRDGQMESDVLAPMAAMAITVVWSKKVQHNHLKTRPG